MAVPQPLTLDLREPQILRHFPQDANAFYWHHRVLLHKISPGVWVGLTPDGDLERINLHDTEHIPLERRSRFPDPQQPYIYAFDDVGRVELERHKRRAQTMAALFNDSAMEDIEVFQWLIASPNHEDFGKPVDAELVDQGVTRGDSGVVHKDGAEVFISRVATSDKEKWLEQMDASRGDVRLLGDHRDSQNKRFLDFRTALTLVKESKMEDWPLQGPRVTLEFLKAVRSGPGDLATYHLTWSKASGVNQHSMICHDHRILCNMLRAAIETDQLDVTNALSMEILCRRIVQLETATARSPLNPDFSGLELVLEDPVGQGGEAVTASFNAWFAEKLKEKASVAKQTRLYKEEFRAGGSHAEATSSSAATSDPKGRGRGRGRDRGRGRGRAGNSDSSAGGGQ